MHQAGTESYKALFKNIKPSIWLRIQIVCEGVHSLFKIGCLGKASWEALRTNRELKFRDLLAVLALNCAFTLSKILILASLQYLQGEKRYSMVMYTVFPTLRVNGSWGMRDLTPCFLFSSGETNLFKQTPVFFSESTFFTVMNFAKLTKI